MSEASWTGGYVVDVEYTHGFYPDLAPLNLAMAAVLAGRQAPDPDRPFTYLELGCGNGFSTALLAAAHPHGRFWGNDFNPAHIHNAKATAEAAGISNVTFLEASFADLIETELPEFDFIVMHGVWSWIDDDNRRVITELIRRRLKPGGLAYVSYNGLPGWSRAAPLRQLMKMGVTTPDAPADVRVGQGLAFSRAMRDAKTAIFADPQVGALLDQLASENPAYVAHEYLNEDWWLFWQPEVAAALAPAGLAYVAQGRMIEAFDQFNLTTVQREVLAKAASVEVTRDFLRDRRFRRDIYGRDLPTMTSGQVSQWMHGRRFALVRLRDMCALKIKRPGGEFDLTPLVFDGVLDALAEGPATMAELCNWPALAAVEGRHIEQALSLLCALEYVQPALDIGGDAERKAATDRFNAVALATAAAGKPLAALASPVTGTGALLPAPEQRVLAAIVRGEALEAVVRDLAPAEPEQAAMRARAENFARNGVPVLKALQVT